MFSNYFNWFFKKLKNNYNFSLNYNFNYAKNSGVAAYYLKEIKYNNKIKILHSYFAFQETYKKVCIKFLPYFVYVTVV